MMGFHLMMIDDGWEIFISSSIKTVQVADDMGLTYGDVTTKNRQ